MYALVAVWLVAQTAPARVDPILAWNEAALQAIKESKTPPPVAARNLAMLHLAMYDAVNAIRPAHESYLIELRPPEWTSPDAAASTAAHRLLAELYPQQRKRLDALYNDLRRQFPQDESCEQGVKLGRHVAEQMLKWRAEDGSDRQGKYEEQDTPGEWKPTPPNFQAALLPQWPEVTPFSVRDMRRFRIPNPPERNSVEYRSAYLEVRDFGGKESSKRTPEQTEIAHFWADGEGSVTPPGHWNRIAQTVARQKGLSPAENARLFALLNAALADASIACWDCKYRFRVWRPVQAIRESVNVGDPAWEPLLPTPPFPAYTSGHSSFSAAAAAVLVAYFKTDKVDFSTTSDSLPGVTRRFASFSDAAREAGQSRIYGGIHWQFDNEAGMNGGQAIGRHVARTLLRPLDDE